MVFLERFLNDLHYWLRQLRQNWAFTITAVLSLALGVGATTAVFSVIYAVLVNPYPYRAPDRMVWVRIEDKGGTRPISLSGPRFRLLEQAQCVESAAAWQNWDLATTGTDIPEDVRAVYFTSNASMYFGVPALLGRGLVPNDAVDDHEPEPVVVLSYNFWRRHFNGSPDVVGKTLQLLRKNYTVVGVLPPRFKWNLGDVYLPLKVTSDPSQPFAVSVRLRPGVNPSAAEAEFQSMMEQFARETPAQFPQKFRVRVERLNDRYVSSLHNVLYILFGAVLLLLLIGCANVSILLLARGTARRHEIALRAALGASRARIVWQLLTESLLLASVGASLGIPVAAFAVMALAKWPPKNFFPPEATIQINMPVLCFTIGLALLTGILFGLMPALRAGQVDIGPVIQVGTRKIAGGMRSRKSHNILIACQVALTLILLTTAAGAMEGFLKLLHTRLGYDPSNTMSVGIALHNNTYLKWEERAGYLDLLTQKISGIAGVVSATVSANAAPPLSGLDEQFEIKGGVTAEAQRARLSLIGPEYFTVLRTPLLTGRMWDRLESVRGANIAVVNASMARQYWPAGDAVGRAIRLPIVKATPPLRLTAADGDQWFQIIGIVSDTCNDGLLKTVKPTVYLPYTAWLGVYFQILIRARSAPLSILRAVQSQVSSVDSEQQVDQHVPTLDELIASQQEWQQEHLVTILFGVFALLALTLAIVGLFCVVSYSVSQRTNEFGIRMALGAQRSTIIVSVLMSNALNVGAGICGGILLVKLLGPSRAALSTGGSHDTSILIVVSIVLLAAAAAAALSPARRASRVDPIKAIRWE